MTKFHVFAISIGISLFVFAQSCFPLDRLFTTQEERIRLDALRSGMEIIQEASEPKPNTEAVTVNGVLLRKSGKHTAWINGDSSALSLDARTNVHRPRWISYNGVTLAIKGDPGDKGCFAECQPSSGTSLPAQQS